MELTTRQRKTKRTFLSLLFILPLLCAAQNQLEVKGTVYALQRHSKDTLKLKNASVYLEYQDSIRLKQSSDENGHYRFLVTASRRQIRLYAQANPHTFCKIKNQYCFLSDGLYRIISSGSRSVFKSDFVFMQSSDCGPVPPQLLFPLNAATALHQQDSLSALIALLRDFPKMKLQIQGHADAGEKHPNRLSRRRAKRVYRQLLQNGIAKNRLSYKSYGASLALISENNIAAAPTEEEKLALRQKNTRLSFTILEFGLE